MKTDEMLPQLLPPPSRLPPSFEIMAYPWLQRCEYTASTGATHIIHYPNFTMTENKTALIHIKLNVPVSLTDLFAGNIICSLNVKQ